MAHIRILMATWNGARHLSEQLASIAAQSHDDWSLWCSDDNSQDATRDLIATFIAAHPGRDIRLFDGPRRGSAANFLSLVERPLPEGVWLAFCDQDDVWMEDRLSRAVACLEAASPAPAAGRVYASRTILTDADLMPQGPSRRHRRPPAFANALVQNILAGNTIVADADAARLLQRTAPAGLAGGGVPHHDWWIYQIASGSGARIMMDDRPGVYYRQHGQNTMAAHRGLRQSLSRLGAIRDRHYADWIDANLAALTAVAQELTPAHRSLLERFAHWRAQGRTGHGNSGRRMPGQAHAGRGESGPDRNGRGRGSLGQLGIHRQSLSGDLALALMARTGHL